MARNVYFSQGTRNEQNLLEDLIIESISIWGQEMFYIPRILVGKDKILGEDRFSQFKHAYPIDMYLESVNGFEGQGAFIQKFGLMMEQSATLTVARRSWERFVGKHGETTIPSRPCEGDLIYFPLTKGLFEIKFVDHQDPFYQLKKLYTYKLQVELFQYNSELIETNVKEIDVFQTLKSFDEDLVTDIDNVGNFGDNTRFREESRAFVFDTSNPFGDAITSQLLYTADSTSIEADSTLTTADMT